jgi:hypothetical protein
VDLAHPQLKRPDLVVRGGCQAERIDRDDEQLLRHRVYGAHHDHPGSTAATPNSSAARWASSASAAGAHYRIRLNTTAAASPPSRAPTTV